MAFLEIDRIAASLDGIPVLRDVSLTLEKNRVLCLLGPSGCGKTTLLRIIAGLEAADNGRIRVGSSDLEGLPPQDRNFGLMFQEFALFPHKTVGQNIAFGLHMQKKPKHSIDRNVNDLLSLVGLEGKADRSVEELSGGERQRVALARSLAPGPRLLMLDEPMGSLDRALRERLMRDLRTILNQLSVTTIFVTHDQGEAFAVADTVAVMFDGHIVQVEHPERLYKKPASKKVARFLGLPNIMDCSPVQDGYVRTELGRIAVFAESGGETGEQALLIRPEAAVLAGSDDHVAPTDEKAIYGFRVSGIVESQQFVGPVYRIRIAVQNGRSLSFDLPNDIRPPGTGNAVSLLIKKSGMAVIPK